MGCEGLLQLISAVLYIYSGIEWFIIYPSIGCFNNWLLWGGIKIPLESIVLLPITSYITVTYNHICVSNVSLRLIFQFWYLVMDLIYLSLQWVDISEGCRYYGIYLGGLYNLYIWMLFLVENITTGIIWSPTLVSMK